MSHTHSEMTRKRTGVRPPKASRISSPSPIKIAAKNSNEQGDILTRLASDLFFTLGYDDCAFDVAKSGRELDLVAKHRYEMQEVRAEFKSGTEPSGGSDINKFVGALDADQRTAASGTKISGYFVSLAGFTSTAIQQERDLGDRRVVLLDGTKVLNELISGGIVAPQSEALVAAQEHLDKRDMVVTDGNLLLIGHHSGWSWAVPCVQDGELAALCMVHADGSPLDLSSAAAIVDLAKTSIPDWQGLKVANKRRRSRTGHRSIKQRYATFIQNEYGGITLEGLPADQSVGSGQFKLESLYVPLDLISLADPVPNEAAPDVRSEGSESVQATIQPTIRRTISEVLQSDFQVAVLGLPGSGKTTLLKRLAVAYAQPERLQDVDDDLPNTGWFPVVIKCRQLSAGVQKTILEIIASQAALAEMPGIKDEFQEVISTELVNGNILLLVDGLDEIAAPNDRAHFVAQLRTFIGVYPKCHLVVTSREAGFRSVAAAVGSICKPYSVGDLSAESIKTLVMRWHAEVVGRSVEIRKKADLLAESIVDTDRVRRLAVNPLLLTTLLLVQRWMGELPRRRSVLYDKAIEVLLMTWNIEGHDPLDKDEVLPQLAYVAYRMMTSGKKSVTSDELLQMLKAARADMPETLSYSKMSVGDFVQRVEERSSIMTLSGHEVIAGRLRPTYEFKHLTFQEYLAATAVVEGWLPIEQRDSTLTDVLRSYMDQEAWQEVITLAAVLAGRRSSELAVELCNRLSAEVDQNNFNSDTTLQLFRNLLGCLRDEALLMPDVAREAIRICVGMTDVMPIGADASIQALYGGKFDPLTRLVIGDNLKVSNSLIPGFVGTLGGFGCRDFLSQNAVSNIDDWIMQHFDSGELFSTIYAASTLMYAAWEHRYGELLEPPVPLSRSTNHVVRTLLTRPIRRDAETLTYLWALAWAAPQFLPAGARNVNEIQIRIVEIWRGSRNKGISRFAAWALSSTVFVGQWKLDGPEREELQRFARSQISRSGPRTHSYGHLGAMVILRYVTPVSERKSLVGEIVSDRYFGLDYEKEFMYRLLDSLGPAGKAAVRRDREQRANSEKRRGRSAGAAAN